MEESRHEPQTAVPRLSALDACRGLICVPMALDHAVYLLWTGAREPSFLFWHGPFVSDETAPELFIRLASSLCAPGFFLLLGCGITLFARARQQLGWEESRIRRHFATRGILLIVMQFTVENLLWTLKPNESWLNYVGVFYALGSSMLLCGLLWTMPSRLLAGIAGILVVLPEFAAPFFCDASEHLPPAIALLILSGKSLGLNIYFPALPWLGFSLAGVLFGRAFAADSRRGFFLAGSIGGIAVGAALLFRWGAGFGNLGIVEGHGLAGTLSFVKYSPSLVYAGWNAGLILLSWPALWWLGGRFPLFLKPWSALGGSPLFFYVAHLALYGCAARVVGVPALSLNAAIFVWFIGLLLLWPICRWYTNLKRATAPDSLLRLL